MHRFAPSHHPRALKTTEYAVYEGFDFVPWRYLALFFGSRAAGMGVLGGFLALRFAGRLPPSADWVDSLGRIICLYWIITGIACPFYVD